MMKKIVAALCVVGLVAASPAWAVPDQVVTGYMSLTGCPSAALTPCFVPFTGSTGGGGAISTVPDASVPTGYQQITNLTASTVVTPAAGSTYCNVVATGAAVMERDDGVAPTASVGFPLAIGQSATFRLSATGFSNWRFIQQAATATLNVACYKDA